ncbi:MAG: hypothetical protein IIZ48_05505 [Erysipelotrichales bacterium]|nr:hypothetical protein [Erysipelotrichales bacterium]
MSERTLDPDIHYALALKWNMLKRKELPGLSLEDFVYAVVHGIWKDKVPVHASEAVDKIFKIKAEDVIANLTRLALTEGATMNMNEIDDLLGRNEL